jgi:NAD(P)-dependent dehydrogenase (short-subunit alcohol dehydrogenase family)
LATARRFVAEGAYVFTTGRRQAELDAAVQLLGPQAFGVRSDISSLADLDQLFAVIKAQKGALDVLFANAGIAVVTPLEEVTEAHFDHHFDINVKGTLFTVQKVLPLLRDGSSVIIMASIVASKGFENLSVYSATKAAIRSFACTWTTDLKARKIRVNTISPGHIETPSLNGVAGTPEQAVQFKAHVASGVPMGRIGETDEIAKALVFLASDDSSFVTGIELFVDGGVAQV